MSCSRCDNAWQEVVDVRVDGVVADYATVYYTIGGMSMFAFSCHVDVIGDLFGDRAVIALADDKPVRIRIWSEVE